MPLKRVTQAGKLYAPHVGGVERHIALLCHVMQRSGCPFSVRVVCGRDNFGPRVDEQVNGVRVTRLATAGRLLSTPITLGLADALRSDSPDLIHFHAPFPWGDWCAASVFREVPTIVTHHMDVVRQARLLALYGPLYRRTLTLARSVLATSAQSADSSLWLREFRHKVVIVPLGVDVAYWARLAEMQPPQPALDARSPRTRPLLLFVGRLVYYKGLSTLIEAVRDLDVTLAIVGAGPLRTSLERQAHGSSADILFLGQLEDHELSALYRSADVFVLPSDSKAEAFGLVLLEAALHGVPMITYRLGTGVDHVNIDGKTGISIGERGAAALRRAIVKLLADEPLRNDLGAAAKERVLTLFSATTMVERLSEIYTSTV